MSRSLRFPVIALVGWALAAGVAAQDRDENSEPKYARMPWHLVDTWWNIGEEVPFESLAVQVEISDDVPDSVSLYIAPIGIAHLNQTPFYGGIQTRSDGYTRSDPQLRGIGPGLLMSMWNERSPEAIRPSDGGFHQSSGHEGDFVSVRRPHRWTKGIYTYRVVRMDRETVGDKAATWVGAFVYSHDRDENIFIGALRFPGDNLKLQPSIANFVEIYGRRRPVEEIPRLTVTFGPPVVNGRPVANPTAQAIYPQGVPDYAAAAPRDGSLVITVGQPVIDRQERRVNLIERP